MSMYLIAVSNPRMAYPEKERERIRRIYADNIELKSRVENLEAKVQELIGKVAEVSASSLGGTSRAQTPQIQESKQQRRVSSSDASTPRPLHIPRRDSKFDGGSTNPSPTSEKHLSAPPNCQKNQLQIPKPIAFLREYLHDLSRTAHTEADDLIAYCAIFKSTADAIPHSALDNVSRSRLFLDGLPAQISRDVHRKCELQIDPQGYLAFDGIFVVASIIVKSVDGYNRLRGKGRWEKRGGGALWTESEMGGYLELIDEISKARTRHRQWVEETGMKCKSKPIPRSCGWDLDGFWKESLLIRFSEVVVPGLDFAPVA